MQLIRNRSMYSARVVGSKPSKASASHGAAIARSVEATAMITIAPVRIVWPKVLAAPSSVRRRLVKIGTNGAVRPAATSTSSAISGIRNAAL